MNVRLTKVYRKSQTFADLKRVYLNLVRSLASSPLPLHINNYTGAKDRSIYPQNCKFAIFKTSSAKVAIGLFSFTD
jgi:hypothetical protein